MFDEIRIKKARNGFTVSVDDEVYVAPTGFKLSELIRSLIDTNFVPDAERKRVRKDKIKKKKL